MAFGQIVGERAERDGSMTSQPELSIVIPVFNSAEFLPEAVATLLDFDGGNIEIIIVDDGSTDHSPCLIEGYRARDTRVITARQENRGQSAARNLGMWISSGKYVMFLDSDDMVDPKLLCSGILDSAVQDGLDVALFDTKPFTQDYQLEVQLADYQTHYRRSNKVMKTVLTGSELAASLVSTGSYTPSATLYLVRREFMLEHDIRFPEGQMMEDNPFTFQIFVSAERARYFALAPHMRRLRSDSISQAAKPELIFAGYLRALLQVRRISEWSSQPAPSWHGHVASMLERQVLSRASSLDRPALAQSLRKVSEDLGPR